MTALSESSPYISLDWDGVGVQVRGLASHLAGDPDAQGGEGCFARWHWDGSVLRLENDRYGFVPLFYWQRPSGVTVAPSLRTLLRLGAPRELDHAALGVFVRCGFYVGEDTPFRAIRAVPSSVSACWSRGVLSVQGRPHVVPLADAERQRDQVMDAYAELMLAAVRRCQPHATPVVLPVSGGRDSRHLLFALVRVGATPALCVTYEDGEAATARRLAAAVGVPHETVPVSLDRYALELRKNWATELLSDEHAPYLDLAGRLAGRGTVFDGIAGDVISSGLFLSAERLAMVARRDWRGLAAGLVPDYYTRLLHPDVQRLCTHESAVERVAAEWARHADAASPVGSFFFNNRTRREIALAPFLVYSALGTPVPVRAPFLDHRLFDYLFSLPAEMTLDGRLHTDTIRRAYPEYADIPFQDGKAITRRERGRAMAFSLQLLARDAVRPSGLLNRRFLAPRLADALLRPRSLWMVNSLGPRAAYLRQLEQVADGGVVPA
jgi:hypothetical protein